MCTANLMFFAVRLSEYGKTIAIEMDSKYLDFAMVIVVPFMFIPYVYQVAWGVLQVVQWVPLGQEVLEV